MKTPALMITLTAALMISTPVTAAQGDLYVYPANGQSAEQLERDRYECYVWASRETGFDPAKAEGKPQANLVRVPVGKNPSEGATIVGTIFGAIAGAAIDDSHRGAAVGATVGTVVGAAIEQEGERQAVEEARQKADEIAAVRAEAAQRTSDYRRAFSACLEGRGYVVR